MKSDLWTLTKLELKTSLGFNEARNSSNSRNKRYAAKNGLMFGLMVLLLLLYSTSFSASSASLGAGETIPTFYILAISGFMALFSFVSSGTKIFNMNSYERLITLPIKPISVIGSRFLVMLLENEIYSFAIFLPGIISYGIVLHPSFAFYPIAILLTSFAPLFPITLASILGVFFTGLFSKTNHKNIITSLLSLVFVVAIVAGSFYISSRSSSSSDADITGIIESSNTINKYYFMASWAKEAWVSSDWLALLYFILVSTGVYAAFVLVTSWRFVPICLSLQEKKSSKQFKMVDQKGTSALFALVKKDLKMYFNSRVYLVNTIVGYIFWVVFAAILKFLPTWLQLTSIEGISETIISAYPFISAFFVMTGSTTSVALSYEAKQWWLTCSLPIKNKTLYASKVIMNMVVFLPFYILSSVLFCSICRPDIVTCIMAFVFPPVFAIGAGYFNLFANILFPKFDWTNEAQVVKNSASSIVSFLGSMLFIGGPFVSFFFVKNIYGRLAISLFFLLLVILFGLFFYWRVNKKELKDIAGD